MVCGPQNIGWTKTKQSFEVSYKMSSAIPDSTMGLDGLGPLKELSFTGSQFIWAWMPFNGGKIKRALRKDFMAQMGKLFQTPVFL